MQQIIINKIQHVTKKNNISITLEHGGQCKVRNLPFEIGKQKYNFETKAPLQMLCTL